MPMINRAVSAQNLNFRFTTEDGTQKMTLKSFEAKPELIEKVGRQATPPHGRETLFLGTDIFSFSHKYLRDHPARAKLMNDGREEYESNPLKYFVPQSNVVTDFLNWRHEKTEHTMKVLHASNAFGKSVAGGIDVLLDIVPCDPAWPIFSVHGVKHRTYRGARKDSGVAIANYLMKNCEHTLWPQVLAKWCPRELIAQYLAGKKSISWRSNPVVFIADTPVFFMALGQDVAAYVSQALDLFWWDEQGTEEKFNNANSRLRRRGGRHVCTMSPQKLGNRADTGAGSFMHRIYKGELDPGLAAVKFFQGKLTDLPNWVMPRQDKEGFLNEWEIGPIRNGDRRKLAEGRSILYGEFHESSGLVFDNIIPEKHYISRFEIPDHWTTYRYHDHGRKEPCAAILVRVSPDNEYFITNEYYVADEIPVTAKGIVREMTGNEIIPDGNGNWTEVMSELDVVYTLGDPRSLSKGLDNARHSIQREYQRHGINIRLGSGIPVEKQIPVLAELLYLRPDSRHFATREMGAPKIYIFDDLPKTRWEFENYKVKASRVVQGDRIETVEKPVAKNDHILTCFMQLAMDRPLYIPAEKMTRDKFYLDENDERDIQTTKGRCPITGY